MVQSVPFSPHVHGENPAGGGGGDGDNRVLDPSPGMKIFRVNRDSKRVDFGDIWPVS